jgi:predicted ArsR family transcriptional regulator
MTDARALRAVAHPLRIRILNTLALMESATATQIAAAVGDTPANCSWHMRQLAKYGYVEEAPGGVGRQRPWRVVDVPRHLESNGDDELDVAAEAVTDVLLDYEVGVLRSFFRQRLGEPAEWQQSPHLIQAIQWLTADEVDALFTELNTAIARHAGRFSNRETRPPGSRPVRLFAWGVPAAPLDVAHVPVDPDSVEGDTNA